jgi:hypothetical protein
MSVRVDLTVFESRNFQPRTSTDLPLSHIQEIFHPSKFLTFIAYTTPASFLHDHKHLAVSSTGDFLHAAMKYPLGILHGANSRIDPLIRIYNLPSPQPRVSAQNVSLNYATASWKVILTNWKSTPPSLKDPRVATLSHAITITCAAIAYFGHELL